MSNRESPHSLVSHTVPLSYGLEVRRRPIQSECVAQGDLDPGTRKRTGTGEQFSTLHFGVTSVGLRVGLEAVRPVRSVQAGGDIHSTAFELVDTYSDHSAPAVTGSTEHDPKRSEARHTMVTVMSKQKSQSIKHSYRSY